MRASTPARTPASAATTARPLHRRRANAYGAIMLGLNYELPLGYQALEILVIRPEIRCDRASLYDAEVRPFDSGIKRQFTVGIDIVCFLTSATMRRSLIAT
jgi:hypothetical protein